MEGLGGEIQAIGVGLNIAACPSDAKCPVKGFFTKMNRLLCACWI